MKLSCSNAPPQICPSDRMQRAAAAPGAHGLEEAPQALHRGAQAAQAQAAPGVAGQARPSALCAVTTEAMQRGAGLRAVAGAAQAGLRVTGRRQRAPLGGLREAHLGWVRRMRVCAKLWSRSAVLLLTDCLCRLTCRWCLVVSQTLCMSSPLLCPANPRRSAADGSEEACTAPEGRPDPAPTNDTLGPPRGWAAAIAGTRKR